MIIVDLDILISLVLVLAFAFAFLVLITIAIRFIVSQNFTEVLLSQLVLVVIFFNSASGL